MLRSRNRNELELGWIHIKFRLFLIGTTAITVGLFFLFSIAFSCIIIRIGIILNYMYRVVCICSLLFKWCCSIIRISLFIWLYFILSLYLFVLCIWNSMYPGPVSNFTYKSCSILPSKLITFIYDRLFEPLLYTMLPLAYLPISFRILS